MLFGWGMFIFLSATKGGQAVNGLPAMLDSSIQANATHQAVAVTGFANRFAAWFVRLLGVCRHCSSNEPTLRNYWYPLLQGFY